MEKAEEFIKKYKNVFIVTVGMAKYLYFPRGKFENHIGLYYVFGTYPNILENIEPFEKGKKNIIESRDGNYKTVDSYRFNGVGFESIGCNTCTKCKGCKQCYICYHGMRYYSCILVNCEKCINHTSCNGCDFCVECGGCNEYNEYKLIKCLMFNNEFSQVEVNRLMKMFKLHPEFSEDIVLKAPFSKLFRELKKTQKNKLLCKFKHNKSLSLYYVVYRQVQIVNIRKNNIKSSTAFRDVKFIFKS